MFFVNDGYDLINAAAMNEDIIILFENLLNGAYSRDMSIKICTNLDAKRKKRIHRPFCDIGLY